MSSPDSPRATTVSASSSTPTPVVRPLSSMHPPWAGKDLSASKATMSQPVQALLLAPVHRDAPTSPSFNAGQYGRTSLLDTMSPVQPLADSAEHRSDHTAMQLGLRPPLSPDVGKGSRMGQIRKDGMLRQDVKETVAAGVIGRAMREVLRQRKAAKESMAVSDLDPSRDADAPKTPVPIDKTQLSKALKVMTPASARNMQTHFSAIDTEERRSTGTMWGSAPPVRDSRERLDKSRPDTSEETDFINKARAMAGDVRAHFYFNQNAQASILGKGHLMSFARRIGEAQDNVESGTTQKNVTELANHDNVFFSLAHKDEPWKPGRFGSASSETGKKEIHRALDGTERRISLPLSAVLPEGALVMPNDHLGMDRAQKRTPGLADVDKSVLVSPGADKAPNLRAANIMEGLARAALHRVGSGAEDASAMRKKMLASSGAELMQHLNYATQRPQLTVPGSVSLHTPGAELHQAKPTPPLASSSAPVKK